MCKRIILVSIEFKSIVSWILYAVIQFSPSNSKLDAVVFLESEIVINTVLKQPWCTKIRQCTNVDEFNRHMTKNRCETEKLEPAQSTLAKLVKALFEMERIFQEKDGKGKTPLFVGWGGGGWGGLLPYISHIDVPPHRVWFLRRFGLNTDIHFAHLVWNRVWFLSELRSVWTYLLFQFQMSKKEREIC